MRRTISNSDNVIDSRDVIARIDELTDERDNHTPQCVTCGCEDTCDTENHEPHDFVPEPSTLWGAEYPEDEQELADLIALQDEADGSPDWQHGETLIRDSYFEDYARELAEDCGMLKDADTWPGRCIDWGRAAGELQQDYMSADYDGITYWIRS